MASRSPRNHGIFRLESLEVRNAPSHFGGLAHAAVALKVHAAAQVRHFSDSEASDKTHPLDRNSAVEQSPDTGVETNSQDPSSIDTKRNDPSGVDASGQS